MWLYQVSQWLSEWICGCPSGSVVSGSVVMSGCVVVRVGLCGCLSGSVVVQVLMDWDLMH